MSDSAGKAMLIDAAKQLRQEWSRVRESWNDQNADAFQHRYIDPIEGHVRRSTEAMEQLADVAAAARRACE